MIPEYKSQATFRFSTAEREQIEKLIREGKYRNISQVIRTALEQFLSKQD